jgi:hypothetical protein
MIKDFIKKIGYENFFMIGMSLVMLILLIVYWRLDYLINVFDNMCYYEYDLNATCSCFVQRINNMQILPDFSNLTLINP